MQETSEGLVYGSSTAPNDSRVCPYCQKSFYLPKDLVRHVRTHTGEKPFTCTLCVYAASRKNHLKKHCAKEHLMSSDEFERIAKRLFGHLVS